MEEIIYIDKPKGITSFDVIRILRKKLGIRKMGHGGTLDPAASGLLIIGINKGTKKLNDFLHFKKTYVMDILLGVKTDTGDMEGKVIEEKKVKEIDLKIIKKVLKDMEGEIEMEAPIYSAIKLKGKPLYKYAREGKEVKPPIRKVEIYYLKLLDYKKDTLRVEMECEKGTYARSVGEEIGKRLEYPATLKDLRRTKIGDIKVEDAKKLEEI
ncbi:MAG: tRNA pseudouridine(55) synthase TruB [Parcubacteria group bacterium]|nr:tRNA pseudouridine(55) synthase TruB [Parcubacteria group bacterium]